MTNKQFDLHNAICTCCANKFVNSDSETDKNSEIYKCNTCNKALHDYGDSVICTVLNKYVTYEWWHETCADDCQRKGGYK